MSHACFTHLRYSARAAIRLTNGARYTLAWTFLSSQALRSARRWMVWSTSWRIIPLRWTTDQWSSCGMKPTGATDSLRSTGIFPKKCLTASRLANTSHAGSNSPASSRPNKTPPRRPPPLLPCCSFSSRRSAARLRRLLPGSLRVYFSLSPGREANELVPRPAGAPTGREDLIVLEHAYPGHTNTLSDISPYKFNGPGGCGKKPWVHVAPVADDYRGEYRRGDKQAGAKYARHVDEILQRTRAEGRGVAAYIAETLPSVGGQIAFPPGYLAEVYHHVRRAGAVCIADEVQVGFGRLGTHFWGFETQGVVPDIVVLGKPIGNAFPLAAVVTQPGIANSFNHGMVSFSTFGGNPVACAAGLAVLDVLEEEKLQQRALRVGSHLIEGLKALQARYALIGDLRGSGLFLAIDLVLDRETRQAASFQASYVVNRLRDRGILAGTDGPHHNVIKLRPPLVFSEADADLFVKALDAILQEDAAQPSR